MCKCFRKKMYFCHQISETMKEPSFCKLDAKTVQLPVFTDNRGNLAFLEGGRQIPFEVKRVFWIYDVPTDKTRGGHAHWTCHEAVFAVKGAFDILLSNGTEEKMFHIDSPHIGILIPAGVWCELRNFAEGTVCVVMASHPYSAEGYVNDFDTYKAEMGRRSAVCCTE